MGESKNFIKNAVGILIVVAICFVAVTIYKKGNESINASLNDYDGIVSQFENVKLTMYENTIVSGARIIELLKSLEADDEVTIVVSNGYSLENEEIPQKYTYESIYGESAATLKEITDKKNKSQYINPKAQFYSSLTYDENSEISSVEFKQK